MVWTGLLKANESVIFENLPPNVQYSITEFNIPAGYTSDKPNNTYTGVLTEGEYADVVFINTYNPPGNVADIQFYNGSGLQLPETGGRGVYAFYAIGSVLMMAALLLVSIKRHKTQLIINNE